MIIITTDISANVIRAKHLKKKTKKKTNTIELIFFKQDRKDENFEFAVLTFALMSYIFDISSSFERIRFKTHHHTIQELELD